MRFLHGLVVLGTGALLTTTAGALTADEIQALQQSLANVPTLELPARAAEAVKNASVDNRSATANAVIGAVAARRPGSVVATVASIAQTVPSAAPAAAAAAQRAIPAEAAKIATVARVDANGKPVEARALGTGRAAHEAGEVGVPPSNPPAKGVIESRPGTIRGRRPAFPPGLVRDPKPGRDPDRDEYGRPE